MALPIPEKKKRCGVVKKVELPINMQSKYMRKCPICKGPFVKKCINCGYKNENPNEGSEWKAEFSKASK